MIIDTGSRMFWITAFFVWLCINYVFMTILGFVGWPKQDRYTLTDSLSAAVSLCLCLMVVISP